MLNPKTDPLLCFAQRLRTNVDDEPAASRARALLSELADLATSLPANEVNGLLSGIGNLLGRIAVREDARRQAENEAVLDAGRGPDNLLDVDEAASRMGVTKRWLYNHHRELPFAKKLGRKTLRFSERGLERWLARQNRQVA